VKVLALVLISAMSLFAQQSDDDFIGTTMYNAVAPLYEQGMSGQMIALCTATAFEKTETGYLFITAAHCVSVADGENADKQKFLFIGVEGDKDFRFVHADVKQVGVERAGEDFAVLDVATAEPFTVLPLGQDVTGHAADKVAAITIPDGFGKMVSLGYVMSPRVNRALFASDMNWVGSMALEMESAPGASGSAIVSLKQRAIVGFLVGSYWTGEVGMSPKISTQAIPVSRFKKFRAAGVSLIPAPKLFPNLKIEGGHEHGKH
jgi:S1-C subfamily serine protease